MVSILLPAYKSQFLHSAIESVLNQSFQVFELIIVNDRSPQDIDSIVNTFSDNRIKYYTNSENIGGKSLVSCWNICLQYASFPYAVMFSDDDLMEKNFLHDLILLSQKYPDNSVFYSRVAIIDDKDQITSITPSAPEVESCLDFIWHRVSNYRNIYAANFMFKVSTLRGIGGFIDFPLAWGSDDATWFSLAKDKGAISTSKILCRWRWSNLNITNVGNIETRLSAVELYNTWLVNFINGLKIQTDTDTVLIKQIMPPLNRRFINTQSFLIQRLFEQNNLIKAIILFFQLKKRFKLKNRSLYYSLGKTIMKY